MNSLVGLVIVFYWILTHTLHFFSKCSPSEIKLLLTDWSGVGTVVFFFNSTTSLLITVILTSKLWSPFPFLVSAVRFSSFLVAWEADLGQLYNLGSVLLTEQVWCLPYLE